MAFKLNVNKLNLNYLTAFADQSEDEATPEFVIPTDFAGLSVEDLFSLKEQALSHFDSVFADGSGFTAEDVQTLQDLTSGIEALQEAIGAREAEAAELAAQAQALATRAKGEDAADGTAEVEPVAEPVAAEPVAEPMLVAAGAEGRGIRVNLSRAQARQPRMAATAAAQQAYASTLTQRDGLTMADIVQAAGEGTGYQPGKGLDWNDVGRIVDNRLAQYNRREYESAARAGRARRQQFSIATVRKPMDPDLVVTSNDPMHIEEVLRRAMNEHRLPGGSLVASGGWCGPSETIYDLCELESRDGIFSLPEIGIARGGINRTLGPNFADLYNNVGFCYTEEEDIDGDYDGQGGGSKPCYAVGCPEFEDIRLSLCGLCVNAGLLASRGYPELIARTVRGALVAHDHKVAGNILNALVAGSSAVTMPSIEGAIAPVLRAIELQVEHMRYINRLGRNATIEGVFPYWVRGTVRADLAQRLGVDLISVPDARIDGWFRERGIAPQFVYNWQDLTGTAANFTGWPTTVKFLLYPAGTWVRGSSDIITLDTIYDSTLLGTNDYTALFTEEGWLAAKMCHDSRVVTVPVCPNGATNSGIDIDCPAGPVVPTTTTTTTA